MTSYNVLNNVRIVNFTGTGGTKRAAEQLAAEFKNKNISVNINELKRHNEPDLNITEDMLIILFPVYAANAPQTIYEFIDILPQANQKPVAVISVSGGGEVFPNKGCRLRTIKRLEMKGYTVVYEAMLIMPANFIAPTPDELSVCLLKCLPRKTKKIAGDILNGTVIRAKPGIVAKAASFAFEIQKAGGKRFGKEIAIDNSCTGCGLCANSCPGGNITMANGRPVYGNNCLMCMKCLYNCPKKALRPGAAKFMVLKGGFSLSRIEKLSDETPSDSINVEKIKSLTKSIAFGGLRKYLLD